MKQNKKLLFFLFLMAFAAVILTIFLTSALSQEKTDSKLTEVASFTVGGCSSCSKSLKELKKLAEAYPDLTYTDYSITEDSDMAEKYSITEHPTVLFLNKDGIEVGRVEKENTLAVYKEKLKDIHNGEIAAASLISMQNTARSVWM